MGPPSSGGSTVGEALNILEQVPGYAADDRRGQLHYFLEASRVAFADRNAYLADPAFPRVPLADAAVGRLRRRSGGRRSRGGRERDRPARHLGGRAPAAARRSTPDPVDDAPHGGRRHGMVVSYTFTIESTGGNGIVVPGWGSCSTTS